MSSHSGSLSSFNMSRERAEEICKAIRKARGWTQVGVCPTKDEDREIIRFWNTLPSGSSYYDAVAGMAKSEHLCAEDRPRADF